MNVDQLTEERPLGVLGVVALGQLPRDGHMAQGATILRPLRSKRAMISPLSPRAKASGFTRIRVRSMGSFGRCGGAQELGRGRRARPVARGRRGRLRDHGRGPLGVLVGHHGAREVRQVRFEGLGCAVAVHRPSCGDGALRGALSPGTSASQ